jgi:hypothetical protein
MYSMIKIGMSFTVYGEHNFLNIGKMFYRIAEHQLIF